MRREHIKEGVPYNVTGVVEPPINAQPRQIIVVGPDNNEAIVRIQNESLLYVNANIADVLALVSLACEDRIRRMVEDVASVAHNRYISSKGVVPSDLQDIATGEGQPETVPGPTEGELSITSKPLDRIFERIPLGLLHY